MLNLISPPTDIIAVWNEDIDFYGWKSNYTALLSAVGMNAVTTAIQTRRYFETQDEYERMAEELPLLRGLPEDERGD